MVNALVNIYSKEGVEVLQRIELLLEDEEKLKEKLRKYEHYKKIRHKEVEYILGEDELYIMEEGGARGKIKPIRIMVEQGIVLKRKRKEIIVNEEFKKLLEEISPYIKAERTLKSIEY